MSRPSNRLAVLDSEHKATNRLLQQLYEVRCRLLVDLQHGVRNTDHSVTANNVHLLNSYV